MTQPPVRSALNKFHFHGLLRLEPLHLSHNVVSDRMLMLAFLLRQIHERHGLRLEVLHSFQDFSAIERIKAGNEPFDVIQLAVFSRVPNPNRLSAFKTGLVLSALISAFGRVLFRGDHS
jgi:hypothetical protein